MKHVPSQGFQNWAKSTHSGGDQGACVEVAKESTVGVRDTKQHGLGAVLEFQGAAWGSFLSELKADGSPLAGGF